MKLATLFSFIMAICLCCSTVSAQYISIPSDSFGACCDLVSGQCITCLQSECVQSDVTNYMGANTTCGPFTCVDYFSLGACCDGFGYCIYLRNGLPTTLA